MWGFALAGGPQLNPLSLSPEHVDTEIARRLTKSLRFLDGQAHLGIFCLPKNLRQEIDRGRPIVTDEDPAFLFY